MGGRVFPLLAAMRPIKRNTEFSHRTQSPLAIELGGRTLGPVAASLAEKPPTAFLRQATSGGNASGRRPPVWAATHCRQLVAAGGDYWRRRTSSARRIAAAILRIALQAGGGGGSAADTIPYGALRAP